jgi:hypothetical protein
MNASGLLAKSSSEFQAEKKDALATVAAAVEHTFAAVKQDIERWSVDTFGRLLTEWCVAFDTIGGECDEAKRGEIALQLNSRGSEVSSYMPEPSKLLAGLGTEQAISELRVLHEERLNVIRIFTALS